MEKTSLKICILELLSGLPCLWESGKTTSLLEEGHFNKLLSFCLVQCYCSWSQDLLRVAKLCHDCKPSNHNNILKKPRQFNSLTCPTLQVENLWEFEQLQLKMPEDYGIICLGRDLRRSPTLLKTRCSFKVGWHCPEPHPVEFWLSHPSKIKGQE